MAATSQATVPLRIALLVEGSVETMTQDLGAPLVARELWTTILEFALGAGAVELVEVRVIHKGEVFASLPTYRSNRANVAEHIQRLERKGTVDGVVVAWDLAPYWEEATPNCRWDETKRFQDVVVGATHAAWSTPALVRQHELETRAPASNRVRPARVTVDKVVPVVMDREFESVLVVDKRALSNVTGVATSHPKWPNAWREKTRYPERDLIIPIVDDCRPPAAPAALRAVTEYRSGKDRWAHFLFSGLAADHRARPKLLRHPMLERFTEVIS